MDLPWGSDKSKLFITNVGLVTSDGPFGPNVMACEWTHHVSYSPGLIAVCIDQNSATHANIKKTKEFGINICSSDQNVLSSISGNYTGKEFDKVKALGELGFKFYKAKKIKAPMIQGAALNVECKLYKEIALGDHTMFVGEAIEATANPGKEPLAYHKGKYWMLGDDIPKPPAEELEKIRKTAEKFKKT